jgi:hypothetical protein
MPLIIVVFPTPNEPLINTIISPPNTDAAYSCLISMLLIKPSSIR